VPPVSSQPASADQPSPDNPDQRMTTDLTLLTQLLRRVMVEFGTAPFRIVFYSWWMWSYTGWLAVGVVYCFAVFGTLLQRSVRLRARLTSFDAALVAHRMCVLNTCNTWCRLPASRIAALVYGQERLEGDLRAAHLRLRAWSVEIALASRGPAEADALEHPLGAAQHAVPDRRRLAAVCEHPRPGLRRRTAQLQLHRVGHAARCVPCESQSKMQKLALVRIWHMRRGITAMRR